MDFRSFSFDFYMGKWEVQGWQVVLLRMFRRQIFPKSALHCKSPDRRQGLRIPEQSVQNVGNIIEILYNVKALKITVKFEKIFNSRLESQCHKLAFIQYFSSITCNPINKGADELIEISARNFTPVSPVTMFCQSKKRFPLKFKQVASIGASTLRV